MPKYDVGDRAELFRDFDIERWTDGTKEPSPHGGMRYVWHTHIPSDEEQRSIRVVTLNLDPTDPYGPLRNYHINPAQPLEPWREDGSLGYDLGDLGTEALNSLDDGDT